MGSEWWFEQIRNLLKLKDISDEEIRPHYERAVWDFKNSEFEDWLWRREAICCKTVYYLCPLLWLKIQQRVNEYDETLQTFEDLEAFQQYWLDRALSAVKKSETGMKNIKWTAI